MRIFYFKKRFLLICTNLKGECHLYKPQGSRDIFSVVLVEIFFEKLSIPLGKLGMDLCVIYTNLKGVVLCCPLFREVSFSEI